MLPGDSYIGMTGISVRLCYDPSTLRGGQPSDTGRDPVNTMHLPRRAASTTLISGFCVVCWLLTGTLPVWAQDPGDVDVITAQIDQLKEQRASEERPTEAVLKEPLGVVEELVITGLPSVREAVIRRQLTFKMGEEFSQWHRWRSVRRLYELGLFWNVKIDYEYLDGLPEDAPMAEGDKGDAEGETAATEQASRPLRVTVAVFQGKSYYFYPYGISESPYFIGAVAGDRDAFGTGKNISAAVFAIDDLEYYSLTYDDPQFGGGHQRGVFTLKFSDSALNVRDERNPSTGESYFLGRDGLTFEYRTSMEDRYQVTWGLEAYDVTTDLRSGTLLGGTKQFLLSGAEIPEGTLTYLTGGISESRTRGYPLTNSGYYWSLNTQQSLEALGSLETFGKYSGTIAGFYPIGDGHAIGGRIKLDTTSGKIPHYEAPLAGPLIRGYTGTDFYSRSALTINTEFRYLVDPKWGQVVAFFDAGKGFDDRTPKLSDLEYGYGAGLRVRTGEFLPIDVVIYLDYAVGVDDYEINVGIGQWF